MFAENVARYILYICVRRSEVHTHERARQSSKPSVIIMLHSSSTYCIKKVKYYYNTESLSYVNFSVERIKYYSLGQQQNISVLFFTW